MNLSATRNILLEVEVERGKAFHKGGQTLDHDDVNEQLISFAIGRLACASGFRNRMDVQRKNLIEAMAATLREIEKIDRAATLIDI